MATTTYTLLTVGIIAALALKPLLRTRDRHDIHWRNRFISPNNCI